VTAILGFVLYRAAIPKTAILPLAISCGGIGIVFYFNPASATNTAVTTTSKGVIFASVGLFASALYTSLVGRYQKRLQVSSMQLLLNQAPVSAGLLLCMAPFLDETPATTSLSPSLCIAIFMVSDSLIDKTLPKEKYIDH
jgi:solute carrier family 35 protein E3